MFNKENILFAIVGLLAGLIIGFMFANSVNQGSQSALAPGSSAVVPGAEGLPAGHPPTTSGNGGTAPEIQAAIETARAQPDNYEAQIKAAELFYQIQRFDGAIEFIERASKIKPDDYTTMVNLGNAYFDATRYDEAEKAYTAALSKRPDDADVRTDLGLTFVFRAQPDYDRAIKEFRTALDKDPKHLLALQNMIVAYTKKGDTGKATEALSELEKVDPTNSSIGKLREDIAKSNQPQL